MGNVGEQGDHKKWGVLRPITLCVVCHLHLPVTILAGSIGIALALESSQIPLPSKLEGLK